MKRSVILSRVFLLLTAFCILLGAAVFAFCLLLAYEGPVFWTRPKPEQWARVQIGMPKSKVEEILGSPASAQFSSAGDEWNFFEYGYSGGSDIHSPHPKAFVVWFDSEDRVRNFRTPEE